MIPGMNKKQMKQMERQMKKMGMKKLIKLKVRLVKLNLNTKLKFLMRI